MRLYWSEDKDNTWEEIEKLARVSPSTKVTPSSPVVMRIMLGRLTSKGFVCSSPFLILLSLDPSFLKVDKD